jgi:hypothetical protein
MLDLEKTNQAVEEIARTLARQELAMWISVAIFVLMLISSRRPPRGT